jgi:hypothetical protein
MDTWESLCYIYFVCVVFDTSYNKIFADNKKSKIMSYKALFMPCKENHMVCFVIWTKMVSMQEKIVKLDNKIDTT